MRIICICIRGSLVDTDKSILITIDEVNSSLDSPEYHEGVERELHVSELFEGWHEGPVKVDYGDFIVVGLPWNSVR